LAGEQATFPTSPALEARWIACASSFLGFGVGVQGWVDGRWICKGHGGGVGGREGNGWNLGCVGALGALGALGRVSASQFGDVMI
jgi:hypothetical protein